MLNKDIILVDYRLYDVSQNATNYLFKPKANEKSTCTLIYCTNIKKCNIIKNNLCLGIKNCPYAKKIRTVGYTKRAKANRKWIQNKKDIIKTTIQKQQPKKLVEVDEYIYFNYPFWNFNTNEPLLKKYSSGIFSSNKHFIEKKDFTVEFLKIVLERKPQSIMGGIITSYQNEEVPKIKKHLKEELPELYNELILKYPTLELKYINNIKRKALLSTIPNNTKFKYNNFESIVDGEYLNIKKYKLNLIFLKDLELKNRYVNMKVKIEKEDTVIIQNNNQWDEKTIFVD